ncbi:MAG: cyclic nucleotide-binding/CBS domain-containing protein [Actinomycetota bacterium]|nr:CBS domain-containing protein [Actinomycetota bacterium]
MRIFDPGFLPEKIRRRLDPTGKECVSRMSLSDVMAVNVVTVTKELAAAEIAQRMIASKVGSALVCDGPTLLGIVTERDILRVVADGKDPKAVPAAECMTPSPVCAEPDWEIGDAARLMVTRGIRHLPVTQDGKIVGMISIRDVLRFGVSTSKHDQDQGREILEAATKRE